MLRGGTNLHELARSAQAQALNLVLQSGCTQNPQDADGTTPLHIAAELGHIEIVELLSKCDDNIQIINKHGNSPLHLAALNGHANCVRVLVDANAKFNKQNINGQTPLHLAASKGHLDCISVLLENGSGVHLLDNDKMSALQYAILGGHTECVAPLLVSGADIHSLNKNGLTILQQAGVDHNDVCVRIIIEHGGYENIPANVPYNFLHYASKLGWDNCVEIMLAAGADVNATDENLETSLHWAARLGHEDCVRVLLDGGAIVQCQSNNGCSPLMAACVQGSSACAVLLIVACGECVLDQDKVGCTALHHACVSGHVECVHLLVDSASVLSQQNQREETPLHFASRHGWTDCVTVLVDSGANINMVDENRDTPLHNACDGGHLECVKILINSGAVIGCMDKLKNTPLHYAARGGFVFCVLALVDTLTDVSKQNINGNTALHQAAFAGNSMCVAALEKGRVLVNSQNLNGDTALHKAALSDSEACVRELLCMRADVHVINNNGSSALHYAAAYASRECVELLIDAGSDLDLINKCGRTPLHSAASGGDQSCVKMLMQSGIEVNMPDCDDSARSAGVPVGSFENVQLLVERGAAINVVNFEQETILHQAVACRDLQRVQFLTEHHADVKLINNKNKSPLELGAEMSDVLPRVFSLLVARDLPYQADGCYVEDNHQSWRFLLTVDSIMRHNKDLATIVQEVVASLSPHLVRQLAYYPDSSGQRIVDIVSAKVRAVLMQHMFFCGRYDLLQQGTLCRALAPMSMSGTLMVAAVDSLVCLTASNLYERVTTTSAASATVQAAGNSGEVEGLGLSEYSAAAHKLGLNKSDAELAADFQRWHCVHQYGSDNSKTTTLSRLDDLMSPAAFAVCFDHCLRDHRRVVIKFITSERKYANEMLARQAGDFSGQYVLPLADFQPTRMELHAELLRHRTLHIIFPELYGGLLPTVSMTSTWQSSPFAMTLACGDRSLEDVLKYERPSLIVTKTILHQVAKALAHVHSRKFTHGYLCARHVMRVSSGHYKLIDFSLAQPFESSLLGWDIHTATLPPEMFCSLNKSQEQEYLQYWRALRTSRSSGDVLKWHNIRPVKVGVSVVVPRTYDVSETATDTKNINGNGNSSKIKEYDRNSLKNHVMLPRAINTLPYDLHSTSPAADLWNYALLLFKMYNLHHSSILPCSNDDQLINNGGFAAASTWTDTKLCAVISANVRHSLAADLLTHLLKRAPGDRLQTMLEVLSHRYFTTAEAECEGVDSAGEDLEVDMDSSVEVRAASRDAAGLSGSGQRTSDVINSCSTPNDNRQKLMASPENVGGHGSLEAMYAVDDLHDGMADDFYQASAGQSILTLEGSQVIMKQIELLTRQVSEMKDKQQGRLSSSSQGQGSASGTRAGRPRLSSGGRKSSGQDSTPPTTRSLPEQPSFTSSVSSLPPTDESQEPPPVIRRASIFGKLTSFGFGRKFSVIPNSQLPQSDVSNWDSNNNNYSNTNKHDGHMRDDDDDSDKDDPALSSTRPVTTDTLNVTVNTSSLAGDSSAGANASASKQMMPMVWSSDNSARDEKQLSTPENTWSGDSSSGGLVSSGSSLTARIVQRLRSASSFGIPDKESRGDK